MQLTRDIHIVDNIKMIFPPYRLLNVVAISDRDSVLVIDCGYPNSSATILEYLRKMGYNPSKMKNLLITHCDIDHAGSAAELKKATGCRIMTGEFDSRIVSGERFSPEQLKSLLPNYGPEEIQKLHGKTSTADYPSVPVDQILRGGEALDIAGGIRVISVPGHTPSHVAFYFPKLSTLVAGDCLSISPTGEPTTPPVQFTPNVDECRESIKKLTALDFDVLVPFHGTPITQNAKEAVVKLVDTFPKS